jgi:hypothetical protein
MDGDGLMKKGIISFNASKGRLNELVTNLRAIIENDDLALESSTRGTPLTILPVCALAKKLGKHIKTEALSNTPDIQSYLTTVSFPEGRIQANLSSSKSCPPIARVDFPASEQELNDTASRYVAMVLLSFEGETKSVVEQSLKYAVAEMTTNVAEHARASHYWLFAQEWPQDKVLEFCLVDDGIGVRSSFLEAGIAMSSDAEAITEATQGQSAKKIGSELPGDRGHGLGSTIKLLTGKDFDGIFSILSGNAGYLRRHGKEPHVFEIPSFSWPGVIIWARVRLPEAKFDFYRYID